MGNLKPIGSEKLQGQEKLNRILEIARYNESIPQPVNETVKDNYNINLPDGNTYKISKEKNGYVIKKTIKEGTEDYLEPMKNRKYYSSYSQAFKRLNLIVKEVNSLVGNDQEISLFGEQKKYTLKTPKPAPELPPAPEPAPMDTPPPSDGPTPDMGMEGGESPMDEPTPDMGMEGGESPMDEPTPDMGSEESDMGGEVTMKTIQKLTGKLGQKIRQFSEVEELSSNDAKYVINSILSAIDLTKLEPEDKEEIMSRLEGEEEGMEDMGDMDSEDSPEPPDMSGDEMPEPEMAEGYDTLGDAFHSKLKGGFASELSRNMEEYESKGVSKILDNVFSESKVEKLLTKYFDIDEKEQRIVESKNRKKKNNTFNKVQQVCETFDQENTSKKLIQKYPDALFVGKTSKNNLLFQINETKVRVTPQGRIL
jgi:hypothetical protein